jgi:NAD(P)-dependent dehydrogenase (short-subunit alcohol dehydrogenase family)
MEKYPLKRYGEPEDIAYGIIYLLSDASSWVTGHSLIIDGGITI